MAALSQAVTKAEAAAELIANEFAAKAREEKEGQQQRTTTNKRKQPNDNAGDDNMKTKKKQLEKEKLQEILATLVKAKLKKHDDDNIPVPITITQRSSLREVEPTVVSPLVVENPETILRQNVECYVSGLLASFPRETLKSMVHEILIVYPQSKYAIKKGKTTTTSASWGEIWAGWMYLYHIRVESHQRIALCPWSNHQDPLV